MDIFNMTCQAFLYRLYSSIVYRRIDGLLISSDPTTTLNPTPFSIPDLFAIYNASFGTAELASPPQSLTSEVISSIRYHTIESLIDFLSQVQVSRSGTRDYYWGSAAVRGLILPMYMDFINVVPVDFVVRGSSAFKSFPDYSGSSSGYLWKLCFYCFVLVNGPYCTTEEDEPVGHGGT